MQERTTPGFTYSVDHMRGGILLTRETTHNIMPVEALDYILEAGLSSGEQKSTWYVGLYDGNYSPMADITAASMPSTAKENTKYSSNTRVLLELGNVEDGRIDNDSNRAEFVSTANSLIYGGFITSAVAKGATTGILLSIGRFSSPKNFEIGDLLRIYVAFAFTN